MVSYYSITFENSAGTKNTWTNWKFIPSTPPMIPFPEIETNYVNIPGRRAGPLDLTGKTIGKLTYKRITGSWLFYMDPTSTTIRKTRYDEICRYFHGKICKVTLEEDTTRYYQGRIFVSLPQTGTGPIKFQLNYDLEPARYLTSNGSIDSQWITTISTIATG